MLAFAGMTPEYERDSLRQKPCIRRISVSPSPGHPVSTIFNEPREPRVSPNEGVGVCSNEGNAGFLQRIRDLVAKPRRSIENRDFAKRKPLLDELWDDRDGNGFSLRVVPLGDVPRAQIPLGGAIDTAIIPFFARRAQRRANDLSSRTVIETQPDGPHISAPR